MLRFASVRNYKALDSVLHRSGLTERKKYPDAEKRNGFQQKSLSTKNRKVQNNQTEKEADGVKW